MIQRLKKLLPAGLALIFALFWGLVYMFFSLLHGMQAMFDRQFPFLFAALLGIPNESMSLVSGVFFAMLDAAVFGFVLGWLVRGLFSHK